MADTVIMPKLGFDMAEGTLVRWVKSEGETVNKGDVLAEIETDKATVEVETSFSGVLHKRLVEQGAIVPVGAPIAVIAAEGEEVKDLPASEAAAKAEAPATAEKPVNAAGESKKSAATPEPEGEGAGGIAASPLARRMSREHGIDLAEVEGSGPGGRIVRRDIEAFLTAGPAARSPEAKPAAAKTAPPLPALAAERRADQRQPVNRLRAAIGRRMTESKQQLPHFYVTHNYDVEPLLALRSQANSLLPEEQKISINDFIVKAVALTLRQYPNLNASLEGDEIIQHGSVNVGVAVAIEGGLLTVVCRDADLKPLRLISAEIRAMVERARQGKVRPEDIEGSTFSISNLGMFDVEHFIAIINPPEAAILAVGSVMQIPVVKEGEVRTGSRMKATLSADHRLTDGAEAAQFMQSLAEYLEDPLRLLL